MVVHGEGELLVPAHLNFGKFMLDRLRRVKAEAPCLHNCTSGVKLTYGEFTQHAVSVCTALLELGVGRDDTVAVAGETCAAYIPTTLAVVLTGAAYTPIELDCGRAVLIHKLNLTKPKYITCSRLFWEAYSDVLRELGFIKIFICFDGVDDIKLSIATMASRHVDVTTFEPAAVKGDDVAMVVYSSGTTGLSKGVLLTHHNCVARTNITWYHGAESLQIGFFVGELWSTYVTFLMFHFISAGKQLIYTENKAAELNIVQDCQVNTMPTVPVGIYEMVASEEYELEALKVVYCAAGHLSPALAKAFKERYPHIKVLRIYGATEADVITVQKPSNSEKSTVGVAVPGQSLKVVDVKTREPLGSNQRGEICVRGPCLMKGYLGASSAYLDDQGFYLTGDLGYYDDQKQFYLVDRLKDVINFKGDKVCPAEVEAVLVRHPAVREAAVVGKPVGTVSELPTAFVVRRPGTQVTEADLMDYVKMEVSWPMQLHGGVRFLSELPRSSLQKVQRRRLKEILALEDNDQLIHNQYFLKLH